ncbi:MAG TPA: alcohol dehydrogenase, partial [Myxococcota bacterium]|nr:alcohol dehydrogenase [Myxococcota bacterium]
MIALPPSRYGAAAPEVRYGPGVSAQLPSWCVGRVGLVSDPGVVAAGLTRPVEAALAARGAEVT